MSYCVYRHTFPNGKVYIGITCQNPKSRWKNGLGYYKQNLIYNAINKYGWKNIKHEIIDSGLNKEEAEQKEMELIIRHQSNKRKFGYNIENGGSTSGKHSKETIKKMSESQIGEKNHMYGKIPSKETRDKISQSLKEKINKKNGKQVYCIETCKTYNSIRHAEDETMISRHSISRNCNGIIKTAGGYHWKFIDDISLNKKELYNGIKKSVRCIETGEIFESLTIAAEKSGASICNISSVANGRKRIANGYHWEFVDKEVS